jgi:hypothetical protein
MYMSDNKTRVVGQITTWMCVALNAVTCRDLMIDQSMRRTYFDARGSGQEDRVLIRAPGM